MIFFQIFVFFSFVFQYTYCHYNNDDYTIGTDDQKKKCLGEVFNSVFVQHTKRWTCDKWHQSLKQKPFGFLPAYDSIWFLLGIPQGTPGIPVPEVLAIFSLPDSPRKRFRHSPSPEDHTTIPQGPLNSMFYDILLLFLQKNDTKKRSFNQS